MMRAWLEDGGFVEALSELGFEQEFDQEVLRMLDAPFNFINSRIGGYNVQPMESVFDLTRKEDVQKLVKQIEKSQRVIVKAREHVRLFITQHLSIEDIL
jgi:hypothetical protein